MGCGTTSVDDYRRLGITPYPEDIQLNIIYTTRFLLELQVFTDLTQVMH